MIEDQSDVVFNGYRFSILEIDEKVISRVRILKEDVLQDLDLEDTDA